jgi:Glycosyltransferase family 87
VISFVRSRPRLAKVALIGALVEFALWCQAVLVLQLGHAADVSDFRAYDVAARIGLSQGWSHIYDKPAQLRMSAVNWPHALQLDYISLPVNAWLATPLTLLPPHAAFLIFASMGWAAVMLSSQLASPPDGSYRVGFALLALGSVPAVSSVIFGQVSGMVMLAMIVCWRLIDAEHEWWAGIALVGIALKPQLAVLVPLALILAGRWRTVAAFAAGGAVLGLTAVVAVGLPGLGRMLQLDASYTHDPTTQQLSLGTLLGGGPAVGLAVQGVVVLVALVPAWRTGRHRVDLAIAAAVCGSLLASIYLHGVDLAVYLLPIWVALRQPWIPLRLLAGMLWLSLDVDLTRTWVTALLAAALLAAFAGQQALGSRSGKLGADTQIA